MLDDLARRFDALRVDRSLRFVQDDSRDPLESARRQFGGSGRAILMPDGAPGAGVAGASVLLGSCVCRVGLQRLNAMSIITS